MKVYKILFIHPSRGRPELGCDSARRIVDAMTTGVDFRYIFSLDLDDPKLPDYFRGFSRLPFLNLALVANNTSTVPAVNLAARQLEKEDLIINVADDFGYSKGWDQRLLRFIDTLVDPEYLVHVPDMPNAHFIPVIQIMSSALYRRLGHFFYPGYVSMFADQDLLEACRHLGAVRGYQGESLGFQHLHPAFGCGHWDETYERENRADATQLGRSLLDHRRANHFGI